MRFELPKFIAALDIYFYTAELAEGRHDIGFVLFGCNLATATWNGICYFERIGK